MCVEWLIAGKPLSGLVGFATNATVVGSFAEMVVNGRPMLSTSVPLIGQPSQFLFPLHSRRLVIVKPLPSIPSVRWRNNSPELDQP